MSIKPEEFSKNGGFGQRSELYKRPGEIGCMREALPNRLLVAPLTYRDALPCEVSVMDEVAREYNRLAKEYDSRWSRYIAATIGFCLEGLELTASQRVLDIACGTGALAEQVAQHWPGITIYGVDVSRDMLVQARRKDRKMALAQGAADQLPFRTGCFDCVVCANAFHCFRQPESSLAEMRRVLVPGGRLVLMDWCDDYLSCKLIGVWLRWRDPAFHRAYGLQECQSRLASAGFEVVSTERRRAGLWGLMRIEAISK